MLSQTAVLVFADTRRGANTVKGGKKRQQPFIAPSFLEGGSIPISSSLMA
jgi:hypothetical protein